MGSRRRRTCIRRAAPNVRRSAAPFTSLSGSELEQALKTCQTTVPSLDVLFLGLRIREAVVGEPQTDIPEAPLLFDPRRGLTQGCDDERTPYLPPFLPPADEAQTLVKVKWRRGKMPYRAPASGQKFRISGTNGLPAACVLFLTRGAFRSRHASNRHDVHCALLRRFPPEAGPSIPEKVLKACYLHI